MNPSPLQPHYSTPRVLVAGAGIGGLCLAQALRRLGVDVLVCERDASLDARAQGYRIHIDPRGSQALQACLPTELFALFKATSGEPASEGPAYLDERMRDRSAEIQEFPDIAPLGLVPGHPHRAVDRLVLRRVLFEGLEDAVRFGRAFANCAPTKDGRLSIGLSDGSVEVADLLVGADGVASAVRPYVFPAAAVLDTGARCVYGKTYLDPSHREAVEPFLSRAFTVVNGPDSQSLFVGGFRARAKAPVPGPYPSVERKVDSGDYAMWVFSVPDERLGTEDPLDAIRERIEGWHPSLMALVSAAEPRTVALIAVREAESLGERAPEKRVTLLGDAVHAMLPTGGEGANAALEDAADLARFVASARAGDRALGEAIRCYEAIALPRGGAAVQRSRRLAASLFGFARGA